MSPEEGYFLHQRRLQERRERKLKRMAEKQATGELTLTHDPLDKAPHTRKQQLAVTIAPVLPKIPQYVVLDISEQTYRQILKNKLAEQPPWARPFLNQFFDWIKDIKPADVAKALAEKKSLKDLYDDAPFTMKMSLGSVRAYLKVAPTMRKNLREGASPLVVKYVFKFDNPQVYKLFMQFSDGEQTLSNWIRDSMDIIGASEAVESG